MQKALYQELPVLSLLNGNIKLNVKEATPEESREQVQKPEAD